MIGRRLSQDLACFYSLEGGRGHRSSLIREYRHSLLLSPWLSARCIQSFSSSMSSTGGQVAKQSGDSSYGEVVTQAGRDFIVIQLPELPQLL